MLRERVEDFVREMHRPRTKSAKTDPEGGKYYTFGPSRISEKCQRRIVMDFMKEHVEAAPEKSNKMKMTLLTGSAVHEYIQGEILGEPKYRVSCHTAPFSVTNPEALETLNRSLFRNWGARLIRGDDGKFSVTASRILNREAEMPDGSRVNLAEILAGLTAKGENFVLTETWIGAVEETAPDSGSRVFTAKGGVLKQAFPAKGKGMPEEFFTRDIASEYKSNLPGIRLAKVEPWIEGNAIGGFIDAVIEEESTGKQYVLELKTAHREDFEKMLQTGHPLPKYIEQATCYMGREGISDAIIFVVNKDLASKNPLSRIFGDNGGQPMFLEFPISFSRTLFETLEARARDLEKTVREALDKGELPKKMDNPNRFPCPWCEYRFKCHSEAYRNVSINDVIVPDHVRAGLPPLASKIIRGRKKVEEGIIEVEQAMKDARRLFAVMPMVKSVSGQELIFSCDENGVQVERKAKAKELPPAAPENMDPVDPFDVNAFFER